MPYVVPKDRVYIDSMIDPDVSTLSVGGFTYYLTRVYLIYTRKSFTSFALLFGVVILSLFEFYRRVVAPYEDKKRDENGEVY